MLGVSGWLKGLFVGKMRPKKAHSLHFFNAGPEGEVNDINSSFWQVVCYVAEVISQGFWALSATCW